MQLTPPSMQVMLFSRYSISLAEILIDKVFPSCIMLSIIGLIHIYKIMVLLLWLVIFLLCLIAQALLPLRMP